MTTAATPSGLAAPVAAGPTVPTLDPASQASAGRGWVTRVGRLGAIVGTAPGRAVVAHGVRQWVFVTFAETGLTGALAIHLAERLMSLGHRMPQQAMLSPSPRPARSPKPFEQGAPPEHAPHARLRSRGRIPTNVEAADGTTLVRVRDEDLTLIREAA
ncbi:hypothetical protein [Streptomyces sp. NPDC002573]|uniref:hypothetical protein n=1 Tax=Streptomyces sp. NPDC002573 TaxID=3364651 RepID=UPI0036826B69